MPGFEGPGSDEPGSLDAWLAEGASGLVAALREAGPDAEVWSWSAEQRTAFWARCMAHETVVHGADAALAARAGYEVPPELAADTIEEWLEIAAAQRDGDPEAAELRGGRSLHLHVTDVSGAEWLITFSEDAFTWTHTHEKATVAVRGTLADLMLLFHRSLAPTSTRVEFLGDADLLDFWLERASFG